MKSLEERRQELFNSDPDLHGYITERGGMYAYGASYDMIKNRAPVASEILLKIYMKRRRDLAKIGRQVTYHS